MAEEASCSPCSLTTVRCLPAVVKGALGGNRAKKTHQEGHFAPAVLFLSACLFPKLLKSCTIPFGHKECILLCKISEAGVGMMDALDGTNSVRDVKRELVSILIDSVHYLDMDLTERNRLLCFLMDSYLRRPALRGRDDP